MRKEKRGGEKGVYIVEKGLAASLGITRVSRQSQTELFSKV
jgi:hypothetical protein